VFAHGTGFAKEFWEPTIDDLYELLACRGDETPKIREAWSIDCPSHGEAALLNEEALHYGFPVVCEALLSDSCHSSDGFFLFCLL
jgi:hypothetical protein